MEANTTVRQALGKKGKAVFATSPDTLVYDALRQMAEKNVGALLVMQGEELLGVFSERDYARKIILAGKSSRQTPVAEAMTSPAITITPRETIQQCMELMTGQRIRHLPVLDEGKVAGVISIGDVVKEIISEQAHVIDQLQSYISGGNY